MFEKPHSKILIPINEMISNMSSSNMFLYSSAIQSYKKVVLSSIESALKNLTNASPFPLKMELLVILQPEIVITISSMYMQDFVG